MLDVDGAAGSSVAVESNNYEAGAVTAYSFEGGKRKDVLTVGCSA